MNRTKILMVIGALAIAGGVSAQTVLQPNPVQPLKMQAMPGNAMQMRTMPTDKTANWFPEMEQMEKRIAQLEAQVAQSNQQMALLRAEIGKLSREESGDKGE